MDTEKERMRELTAMLDEAARVYYQGQDEVMSNYEYDRLYDELVSLEQKTGITLAGSPTNKVGYEVVSELPKEKHEVPSLSLDKTKEPDALKAWLADREGVLSWKMDGLTVVITYREGKLLKAVTRGNGEIGEVITANARTFKNLPLTIPFSGELVVRGEAVIKYSDFQKINEAIEDENGRYKNPRNLCSGSVRQLSSEITAKRNVHFFAFSLVKADDADNENSRAGQFAWLSSLGFEVVEYKKVTKDNVADMVTWFSAQAAGNDFPSDGLVLSYDDIAYGNSLGRTAKFPRDSIAFKWKDELADTVLRDIEWSASRTGLINPIAIFDPVELEGTTVSRASVHNISIMEQLELGIGDSIRVYKANMIIPQIAENITKSGNFTIPDACPVCKGQTKIRQELTVKSLYCTNPDCVAKKIKAYTLFVSRDAMNIDGMSEATIEKFINAGIIKEFADFFHLSLHRDVIVNMEGFGEKSYNNLLAAVDAARTPEPASFLYSLGITGIGLSNAKVIVNAGIRHLSADTAQSESEREALSDRCFAWIRKLTAEALTDIEGIGQVLAKSLTDFFADEKNNREVDRLLKEITFAPMEPVQEEALVMEGLTFVVTGSVHHFANRNEIKALIEEKGGKVAGSVSSKTSYLINNDAASGSAKNKKAKELGIPILTEEDFLARFSLD